MEDVLTQKDFDLLEQWGACEDGLSYCKVGQSLSEIPIRHRDWAIEEAAYYGYYDVVNRLIEAGVSQTGIDDAICGAAQCRHLNVVNRLLEVGVSQDTINYVIWWVAKFGNLKTVTRLLEVGASQKAIDDALWVASHYGHTGIANLLKKYLITK